MPDDKKERVVLVTGGSRGIGRAICAALASAGTHVFVNYVSSSDLALETEEIVRSRGGTASSIRADVSKEQDVKDLFKTIEEERGRLDVLVNNAGITRDGLLARMKEAAWDEVLDVNLKGAFLCIKAASRLMLRQRSGRIINVTSVVGFAGNAGQANYAASKAGIVGLTKSAALELAPRNITVNAVAPGLITTDMTRGLDRYTDEDIAGMVPLGRAGKPEDAAAAVAFLASEEASYITGQVIHVNGGMYM